MLWRTEDGHNKDGKGLIRAEDFEINGNGPSRKRGKEATHEKDDGYHRKQPGPGHDGHKEQARP